MTRKGKKKPQSDNQEKAASSTQSTSSGDTPSNTSQPVGATSLPAGPPTGQQHRGPPTGQQHRGPPTGQQHRGPPTGQQHRGPPTGQQQAWGQQAQQQQAPTSTGPPTGQQQAWNQLTQQQQGPSTGQQHRGRPTGQQQAWGQQAQQQQAPTSTGPPTGQQHRGPPTGQQYRGPPTGQQQAWGQQAQQQQAPTSTGPPTGQQQAWNQQIQQQRGPASTGPPTGQQQAWGQRAQQQQAPTSTSPPTGQQQAWNQQTQQQRGPASAGPPPGQQQAWNQQTQQQRGPAPAGPPPGQQQAWGQWAQQQQAPTSTGPPTGQQQAWNQQTQQQRGPASAGPPPGQQQAWGQWAQQQQAPTSTGPLSGQQQAWGQQTQQQRGPAPAGPPPGQQQAWNQQSQQQRGPVPAGPPPGQQQAWGQLAQQQQAPTSATASPGQQQPLEQQDNSPQQETTRALPAPTIPVVQPPTKEFKDMRITSNVIYNIPKRKNVGTIGMKIKVFTNMLEIKFGKRFPAQIYHYDVSIKPEKKKYLYRKAFAAASKQLFPGSAMPFDGKKNAYSAKRLINEPATIKVNIEDDDCRVTEYTVTIQEVASIQTDWIKRVANGFDLNNQHLTCVQALNVILNEAAVNRLDSFPARQSFFTPPQGQATNLGNGMDLWLGLFQSVTIGWKPLLNVDVAHKAFFKEQNLIDLIKVICFENSRPPVRAYGRDPPQQHSQKLDGRTLDYNRANIKETIQGLRVSLWINDVKERSRQVIKDIANKKPQDDFFDIDGKKISVYQYYQQSKKYTIREKDLPCIILANDSHVPIETCWIERGQSTEKPNLKEKTTATMVREAATNTDIRKKKILDAFKPVNHNTNPCVKEFDISISGEFQEVDARILPAPTLYYNQGRSQQVKKGVWQLNGVKFNIPCTELSPDNVWTILKLDDKISTNSVYDFAKTLVGAANNLGIAMGAPKTPFGETKPFLRDIEGYLRGEKKNGIKFVIVIFPDRMKESYPTIKQVAELKVGILTQCLKSFTFKKKLSDYKDMSTIVNILQKINAKLNGVNHSFLPERSRPTCLEEPCMIVGADVTHPSPQLRATIPSIAAVVASHDPNAQFQYNTEIRFQPPKEEIIQDLQNIMMKQLRVFYEKTSQKPKKIIYYRDGVSEGFFKEVMTKEITAIRNACRLVQSDGQYKPPITFIVVQKRHHTRLFPTRKEDSDDRNFNVKAGTIVDSIITHPSHIDFYLVSHASIQGTARPTKYRCLWDDSNMTEDEIEKLTYYLCHMFSRCARSVSYPAPTYYAHLAAFRARNLIYNVQVDLDHLDQEQLRKLTIQPDIQKNPMFFT